MPAVRTTKKVKWDGPTETKLALILLAWHHQSGPGGRVPRWETVAQLMGEKYTAGGVAQHFTKVMLKCEHYRSAKQAFGARTRGEKEAEDGDRVKKGEK
jgi:hypothetical protein